MPLVLYARDRSASEALADLPRVVPAAPVGPRLTLADDDWAAWWGRAIRNPEGSETALAAFVEPAGAADRLVKEFRRWFEGAEPDWDPGPSSDVISSVCDDLGAGPEVNLTYHAVPLATPFAVLLPDGSRMVDAALFQDLPRLRALIRRDVAAALAHPE